MTRPDDIPQDVWDAAIAHLRRAWKAKGNAAIGASHAILAAKAEEREAIAQMADALADLFDGRAMRCAEEMDIVEARGAESAVRKFAAELRGER